MQDAEALGGAGQRDIKLGRATWAVGQNPLRLDHQDRVELQALGLRRRHRARHVRRPDHDAGAFTARFVADEFLDSHE